MGVNKVEYYGTTLIDTTDTTVSEDTLMEGETAINAAGEKITGKLKAVEYKAQNPTAEEQAQARENIDALGREDLPEAINTALAQAKESGQFDGKDGQDGQPGKDGEPGSDGKDGSNGEDGVDGVGIDTIQQVVESTESGGENVWRATLTDGKTSDFTVRNGKDGADGKTAYESAQDGGYTGTEEQFMKTLANCVTGNHEHDWNEITDRPFGEFAVGVGSNTVTSNDIVYGKFRKVSDAVPTLAEVQRGGKISYYKTDQQYGGAITGELVTTNYPQGDLTIMNVAKGVVIAYDGIPLVVVADEDGVEILFNTFEKGTHFNQGVGYYCVHSLTINSYSGFEIYETRTIPEKYLPEGIGNGGSGGSVNVNAEADKAFNIESSNTIKWDGNTEGLTNIGNADFKVSSEAPTISEAQQGGNFKYAENNELKTFNFAAGNISAWNSDIYAIYGDDFGEIIVVLKDGASYNDLTNLEKGTYISSYSGKYVCEATFNGHQFKSLTLKSQALSEHTHDWYGDVVLNGNTIKSDCLIHGESGTYVKVSDATPSLAELEKGGMIRYYSVSNSAFSELYTNNYLEGYFDVSGNSEVSVIAEDGLRVFAVIAYKAIPSYGPATYPYATEPGIYFRQDASLCVHSLTINEYEGLPYNMEKIPTELLPENAGGGSGVSSWNDLTDKPFGETTTYSDTLTWDGNTDGLYNLLGMFYHVSDVIPTLEEAQQGGSVIFGGYETQFTTSDIVDLEAVGMGSDAYIIMSDGAYAAGVALKAGATATMEGVSVTFEKAGLYFLNNIEYGQHTSSLTINNYQFIETEITPIEPKYLPFGGVSFVDITGVSFTDNSFTNATANKTFEEIITMISQGMYVVARLIDGEIVGFAPAILAYGNAMINFALITDGNDRFISILSDNSISVTIK